MEFRGHYTYAEAQRYSLGPSLSQRTTFCVIRNPWDRFISLYSYARMVESHYHSNLPRSKSDIPFGEHLDYEKLKDATLLDCAHMLVEGQLEHDRGWNHWLPQSNWILGNKGEDRVNYKLRFDYLKEDLSKFCREVGLESQPLARVNAFTRKAYRELFDSESRSIVAKYYAEDMERFRFVF